MSWINSNATYKQNSKNDLSFYHGFSKTPVEPTSTGTAATTLGNASTKGGHTVIGTEVWAEEIPWFGLVPSRAVAVTRLSGLTKLNDLVKVDGEGGKVYKYIGADDATFTEDTWADFWEEVTLTNGMTLNNRHKQPVLRYYLNQPMQTLTTTNNASIDSKGYATRLFVNESNHTGQTSGGSVVSQFAAGTDNIKNGIPSVELNPKLYLGTTEKIAGTHYYDYNVSGTILWSTAVTSSSPKISCFRYIGKTVTGQLSTVESSLSKHTADISDIKLALGIEDNPNDPNASSVTQRVETVEDVVRVLLGLDSDDNIEATKSISTIATDTITSSIADKTSANAIGKAIEDAKNAAIAGSTVTLTADTTEGNTGITIDPNGDASNEFTIGIDQSIIATVASVTAITNIITDNKEEIDGKISTINGILEGLTSGDNSISAQIQAVTDRLSPNGDIGQAIASKVASVTLGTVPTGVSLGTDTKNPVLTIETASSKDDTENSKLVTGGVAKEIAKYYGDLADGRSLVNTNSSTQGTYVTVTTSGTVKDGLTVTVNDSALASTVSAAASAIQTVKVNGSEITKSNTEVDITAIVGVDETYANGIRVLKTSDNKVKADVTPAIYSAETGKWNLEGEAASYFTTASDVASVITAVSNKADLLPALENTVEGISIPFHSAGYKYLSISAATYTPSSESGEIGSWTDSTKNYLVTGATVAAAISDVNAKVDALHQTPQFKVEVVTGVTDLTKWEESVTDGIKENYIYLVENSEAADGSYIEFIAYKNGETIVTERIGTTKTDLSGYVKTVTINGQSYTATANNAGTINIGKAASSIASGQATTLANQGSVYGHIADNGTLTLGVADASTSGKGLVQLASSVASNSSTAVTTAKAVKDYADTKVGSVTAGSGDALTGLSVSVGGTATAPTISVTNGIINKGSLPATAKVVANGLVDGGTDVIETEKINFGIFTGGEVQAAIQNFIPDNSSLTTWIGDMPNLQQGTYLFAACSSLTSFCGDLSSMVEGQQMFEACSSLTSFCGDLSSMTGKANNMFSGCKLDAESLDCIAETLPTIEKNSSSISIGYNCPAADAQAAYDVISGKGWNCTMTYNA